MKWAFAVACVATASADEGSPIGKIIEMITDLQAKVIAEGEETQKIYEPVSVWCEERSGEIQAEIKTSKGVVMNLQASIEKEGASIQTDTSKIEDTAGEIASAEADLAAATKIRNTETADFQTFEADVSETIDTLERAIGVIEKELAGGASMMQLKPGNVVQALSAMVSAEAISSSDGKKLTALVQSDSDDDDNDSGAPAAAVFEHNQVDYDIVGVLNGLLDKANAELEGARATEKSSLQNFEMLRMSLKDQIKFANKELDAAKKSKAESEEFKGTAEGDLGVTTADLNEDVNTLASVHHICMSKASEFEVEVTSRGEELKALATAKKIVIEATSLAQTSFLQISTKSDLVSFEAVRYVRDVAKKLHSTALAQLASRMDSSVRFGGSNKEDVFVKIKGLLNDMIAKLEAEAEADATEKAFCDEEVPEAQAKVDDKADEIEKLTAKIDKMIAKSKILKGEVAATEAQLGELIQSGAEMDKIRLEEKALFEPQIPVLAQAVAGIQQALKVLNDYYSKNANHDSAEGASTGIIGLLEVCESDFSKEIAELTDAENKAIYFYEQLVKENDVTKVIKEQDIKFKTRAAAGLDKSVSEYSSDRAGVVTERDAVSEQLRQLQSRCAGKATSYDERKARREEEMASLQSAMSVLENETALIQTKSKHFMSVYRH